MNEVLKTAKTIATYNPTSVRVTKQLHYKANELQFERQLQYSAGTLIEFLKSDDAKEALDSKEQNRAPVWKNN